MEDNNDDQNYGNVPLDLSKDQNFSKKNQPQIYYEENEKWHQAIETNDQITEVIADLDVKLNRVLAKQEYEYLKGYNIYVKKKEKELRQLIDTLNKKNSTSNTKDQKINELNSIIQKIRNEQMNLEKMREKQRKETLKWRSKAENLDEDCKFLQKQVKETKKQNQLLKLAITRLQYELENRGEKEGNTFLTEAVDENTNMKPDEILELLKRDNLDSNQLSILEKSNLLDTSANTISLNDISKSKMSYEKSNLSTNRNKQPTTRTMVSNYLNIPTQNIKYEAFLDTLFSSKHDDDRK
jgi:chromosome segregation ATPase